MTILDHIHGLTWTMYLTDHGYTCWTLCDQRGRRWGWVINASTSWDAHVGDFGQAATIGMTAPPLKAMISHAETAAEGRVQVEEEISRQWSVLGNDQAWPCSAARSPFGSTSAVRP